MPFTDPPTYRPISGGVISYLRLAIYSSGYRHLGLDSAAQKPVIRRCKRSQTAPSIMQRMYYQSRLPPSHNANPIGAQKKYRRYNSRIPLAFADTCIRRRSMDVVWVDGASFFAHYSQSKNTAGETLKRLANLSICSRVNLRSPLRILFTTG